MDNIRDKNISESPAGLNAFLKIVQIGKLVKVREHIIVNCRSFGNWCLHLLTSKR